MGRLSAALGQRVYLDTNIVIYIVEGNEKFSLTLKALLDEMSASNITVVTSEITIAEVLVKPFQTNSQIDHDAFMNFLSPSSGLEIIPIDREILESSARIRATTKLKLPDAIHWATADLQNCDSFLTNDRLFKNLNTDAVKFISDISL